MFIGIDSLNMIFMRACLYQRVCDQSNGAFGLLRSVWGAKLLFKQPTLSEEQGGDTVLVDVRTSVARPAPVNKLSEAERVQLLAVANSPEFASLPPSQIVSTLTEHDGDARTRDDAGTRTY
ncbi:hypothetical protein FNU76_19095 [Chitinimonas arctica]|uniref:Uncharacterized protein n=1 Tax=Chitinimonas arctica TaxID=2594795 RepID=A0A516SJG8_9NEIS|nr:hypothetical protein [Chitinimonas arctica]QDQ28286.1 hypothetical protein FNU76_19095 [Chitinimonas arctica]